MKLNTSKVGCAEVFDRTLSGLFLWTPNKVCMEQQMKYRHGILPEHSFLTSSLP